MLRQWSKSFPVVLVPVFQDANAENSLALARHLNSAVHMLGFVQVTAGMPLSQGSAGARDLRRGPAPGGSARIAVVVGDHHDRLIRAASSTAQRKFVVGSNRLGSTARPGALMQGGVAGGRPGVAATALYTCLLYTSPSPRDRTRTRMPSSS